MLQKHLLSQQAPYININNEVAQTSTETRWLKPFYIQNNPLLISKRYQKNLCCRDNITKNKYNFHQSVNITRVEQFAVAAAKDEVSRTPNDCW